MRNDQDFLRFDRDDDGKAVHVHMQGWHPLRRVMDQYKGFRTLGELTVGADDPFRMDTDAKHRDAFWIYRLIEDLDRGPNPRPKYHIRGLHYAAIGRPLPDGRKYANTKDTWEWIGEASRYARWLGYLPFDRIVDERNDRPVKQLWTPPPAPFPFAGANGGEVDMTVEVPGNLDPYVFVSEFEASQTYHLVMWGEKTSLRDVLQPVAKRFQADLYLPTGDTSETLIYEMVQDADRDGRPLVVFYFADCDPSGWNMAIVISRKLQALREIEFPDLDFRVYRAGLKPSQVSAFNDANPGDELPTSVIKEKEARKVGWEDAWGMQQVELDALVTLHPEVLAEIATEALEPYYDRTLARRAREAREEWVRQAREALDAAQTDEDRAARAAAVERLAELKAEAVERLAALKAEAERIIEEVGQPIEIEWPEIVVPEPVPADPPPPLIDSDWDFATATGHLIESRNYERED